MAIGTCDYCGKDIVAPADVLIWTKTAAYHRRCYRLLLVELARAQVAARLGTNTQATRSA